MTAFKYPDVFRVTVGQVWKSEGQFWHVPRQETELEAGQIHVIRCRKTPSGFRWIYPREDAVWGLSGFADAELVEDRQEDLNA